MSDQIKIVTADDHPIVRQGLRQMIEADKSLFIIGEAGNGVQALELIETHQPDVAVIDIDMPGMNGFALVRALRERKIRCEIVFLTMHSEDEIFQTALDLGVNGYILKDSVTTDITAGIKAVAAGKAFISPALSMQMLNHRRRTDKFREEKPALDSLSVTERRVLRLIADEKTSKEIARELFISPRTVDTHRNNISKKLNLSGTLALIKFAITHRSEL